MAQTALTLLTDELKKYFEPILFLKTEEQVFAFLEIAGWDIREALGPATPQLIDQVDTIKGAVVSVIELVNTDDIENIDIEELFFLTKTVIEAITSLPDTLASISIADGNLGDLPGDVFNALTVTYLRTYQPVAFSILEILTIIRTDKLKIDDAGNLIITAEERPPIIRWDVIPDLLTKPHEVLKQHYLVDGFSSATHTTETAKRIFAPLAELFSHLGFDTALGYQGGPNDFTPELRKRMEGFLTVAKEFSVLEADQNQLGLTLGLVPADEGGPGLQIMPFGKTQLELLLENWLLWAALGGEAGVFQLTRSGVEFLKDSAKTSVFLQLGLVRLPDEATKTAFLIGKQDASHFSIGQLAIRTELAADPQKMDYGVYLVLNKVKLQIKGGDGFIATILGDGLVVEVDLEVGYSNKNGFHFKGSGDLEITLPSHISLGPLQIKDLTLGIGFQKEITLKTHATIKLELGPFVAVVEGLGLKSALTFPDGGGNLGPADLAFGFKPPTGIGLSLDLAVVKGGGYLFFDPDNERYGGALELVIADKISVVAIALITTRFPDGSEGFSLLLLVSVEFSPGITLGMGFFLSGLGGIIGLNRTVNTDALREGVKQGSVDHILFPTDVVANIQRIITDLREFFPPQQDQFVIGLMAKITWGVPTLLSVEFGIAVEFASPVRLVILGVIKVVLPTEDQAIIRIQVNFVGVIDFEEGYLMFDASLFGSKILTFTLEGDMALRLFWGKQQEFLLSVGGFHPAYSPPAYLKVGSMTRLTLNILSGNPSLTLTAYFAITSNTVQFGALIDFHFKVSKFKVIGYFGFDVLFQFSPFQFMASVRAGVAVKLGSTTLLAIQLAFDLQGPTPWIANGTASFKILFVSISVKFSKTWGEHRQDILPDIAILPKLIEALEQPRNWVGDLPANKSLLTSMKKIELAEGEVIMSSEGTLTIRQTILPLGMEITKFGNHTPSDISNAFISKIKLNGAEISFQHVKDGFAPAEFKDMQDEDKLKAPSYKDEVSGAKISSTERLQLNYGINRAVAYEVRVSDYDPVSAQPYPLYRPSRGTLRADKQAHFRKMARGGSIGKSVLSKALKEKSFKHEHAVQMDAEKFVIANVTDLRVFEAIGFRGGTAAEADDRLKQAIRANPALKGKLQVVNAYELVEF